MEIDNATQAIKLRESLEEESSARIFGALELVEQFEKFKLNLDAYKSRFGALEARFGALEERTQVVEKLLESVQKALESVVNNANNANSANVDAEPKKTPKKRALNTATDLSEPLVVPNEAQTSAP
ncbi:hypothetical protein [Helicobacter labacensis]|uniref:hypothetical protein n=1 Tax=Helicobacter labacensis TaxID=2316079 RepID=UPI000EAD4C2C|nr:hypothetical protein [Helicobacter labacensis]